MTEAKHTPGPWSLHKQGEDLLIGDCDWSLQTDSAGAFLLFCHHPNAPAEANASLIAAAPEMLAALKLLLASPAIADFDHGDPDWGDAETVEAIHAARSAIDKAKGGV